MGKLRRLNRRMFLGGGVATTIALPFLDAMVPLGRRASAAGEAPCRLVFVHVRNGMIRTRMRPSTEGTGYTMPSQLAALEPHRDHVNILSGISNKPGSGYYVYPDGTVSNHGPGDHVRDTGTFLTAQRLRQTSGSDIQNGISVDQVAANHLRDLTPAIPSLVLTTRDGQYGNDSYVPVYHNNISWIDATTPATRDADPLAVFDRLFAGIDPEATAEEIAQRRRLEQSVLDSVTDDINRLQAQVGAGDREKLDEYFTGVRHLETRLTETIDSLCDPGDRPTEPTDWRERVDLNFELIKLAFSCDRTRVATLQLVKDGSYDFLGITAGHHQISHLEGGSPEVTAIETINRWQIEAFANLITKLRSATDTDGQSLLYNSLVLFGGGLDGTGHANGDETLTPQTSGPVHRHTNLPLFLAGNAGGQVTTGRHIAWNDDEPIADLYISMLHTVGAMETSFGIEGTGPIGQLT